MECTHAKENYTVSTCILDLQVSLLIHYCTIISVLNGHFCWNWWINRVLCSLSMNINDKNYSCYYEIVNRFDVASKSGYIQKCNHPKNRWIKRNKGPKTTEEKTSLLFGFFFLQSLNIDIHWWNRSVSDIQRKVTSQIYSFIW